MKQNYIKPKFLVFPSRESANKYASDLIVKTVAGNPNSLLGLSTDNNLLSIYKNLIDANKAEVISFSNVTTINTYEFIGVDAKNYNGTSQAFMDLNLFDHIDINKENTFFPIPYDFDKNANPQYDYVDFDRYIESRGFLDILITGVGNNGELALNQQNTPFENFTSLVELNEISLNNFAKSFGHKSLVPSHAVTMGLQSILYSKKIVLVAFGIEKAEALYNLFFNNEFDSNWPVTALNYHQDVVVICDKEASTYIMDRRLQQ